MSMTRKHFKLIAEALKDSEPSPSFFESGAIFDEAKAQWIRSCKSVASVLGQTNPSYDKNRFLDACGIE